MSGVSSLYKAAARTVMKHFAGRQGQPTVRNVFDDIVNDSFFVRIPLLAIYLIHQEVFVVLKAVVPG
jgi:hypothetical protein